MKKISWRRRIARSAWVAALALGSVAVAQEAPPQKGSKPAGAEKAAMETPKVGAPAPDLKLKDHAGKEVALSEFKGKKNVLLAFFPKAFTGG